MPEQRELILQRPDMMHDHFYVKIEGKTHQKWEQSVYHGEKLTFFLEEEQRWLHGKVDLWYIEDGSGNAPGANAHFFIVFKRNGEKYKYDLHDGLRIRMTAPTEEELVAMSTWCEGGDWEGGEYYEPVVHVPCSEQGKKYVTQHGQSVWYCDKHKPDWLALVAAS